MSIITLSWNVKWGTYSFQFETFLPNSNGFLNENEHCLSLTVIAEEILGSNTAIWMSNDGHLMLYGTFNDTNVMEQKFPWYGSSNGDNNGGSADLYPEIKSIRWARKEDLCLAIIRRKLGVKIKFFQTHRLCAWDGVEQFISIFSLFSLLPHTQSVRLGERGKSCAELSISNSRQIG